MPDFVRELVDRAALDQPELTPRELVRHLTDTHESFVCESSAYRILMAHDLAGYLNVPKWWCYNIHNF